MPGTGIELDLEDPESRLYGHADRIERSGDRTRIVDLKSGLHQGDPTADQHRQLLLYAVLAQRSTGEWPSEIAIEDASGAQTAIELDATAAENALAEVVGAVSPRSTRTSAPSTSGRTPSQIPIDAVGAPFVWCAVPTGKSSGPTGSTVRSTER